MEVSGANRVEKHDHNDNDNDNATQLGLIEIGTKHRELHKTVLPILRQLMLKRPFQNQLPADHSDHAVSLPSFLVFHDFGIRYELIGKFEDVASSSPPNDASPSSPSSTLTIDGTHVRPIVELHVNVPGWANIAQLSVPTLKQLYGPAFVEPVCSDGDANDDFDFKIRLDRIVWDDADDSPTPSLYADKVAQLRLHILGSKMRSSLINIRARSSLVTTSAKAQRNASKARLGEGAAYIIPMLPCCGVCHCMETDEKFMAIFSIGFGDDLEWAIARRFLQQFQGAKESIAATTHIEFRRSDCASKELVSILERCSIADDVQIDESRCCGYLSFTFFPSHVAQEGQVEKAVGMLVNFVPYLVKHVKSAKMLMHGRMRRNKDDLLRELQSVDTLPTKHRVRADTH